MRARGGVRGDCAISLVVNSKLRGREELGAGFVVTLKGDRVFGAEVVGVRGMAVVDSIIRPKEINDDSCIVPSSEWAHRVSYG